MKRSCDEPERGRQAERDRKPTETSHHVPSERVGWIGRDSLLEELDGHDSRPPSGEDDDAKDDTVKGFHGEVFTVTVATNRIGHSCLAQKLVHDIWASD